VKTAQQKQRDFGISCLNSITWFVRYISGKTCEKGLGFLPILSVNIVCDDDATGIVRGDPAHD
jgi:hypothetical protein